MQLNYAVPGFKLRYVVARERVADSRYPITYRYLMYTSISDGGLSD